MRPYSFGAALHKEKEVYEYVRLFEWTEQMTDLLNLYFAMGIVCGAGALGFFLLVVACAVMTAKKH